MSGYKGGYKAEMRRDGHARVDIPLSAEEFDLIITALNFASRIYAPQGLKNGKAVRKSMADLRDNLEQIKEQVFE